MNFILFSLSLSLFSFSFDQTHASVSLESARGKNSVEFAWHRSHRSVQNKGSEPLSVRGMGQQITLVYRSAVFTKANYDDGNNESKVSRDFSRFLSR